MSTKTLTNVITNLDSAGPQFVSQSFIRVVTHQWYWNNDDTLFALRMLLASLAKIVAKIVAPFRWQMAVISLNNSFVPSASVGCSSPSAPDIVEDGDD